MAHPTRDCVTTCRQQPGAAAYSYLYRPPLRPSQRGGKVIGYDRPEGRIAAPDKLIEVTVENAGSGLERQMGTGRSPSHRSALSHHFWVWHDDIAGHGWAISKRRAKSTLSCPDVIPCLRIISLGRTQAQGSPATISRFSSIDQRRCRSPRVITSIRCNGAVI